MPTVTVVDGIVLVHGRRVLPALVDSDSDLSESGSTSSQATEASHWGSSQTAEVSNCGRSSPKTAGDSDSIIDGHITGSHEVDNEASFSHRYESEIEDESCFEAAAYDDLYCSSPPRPSLRQFVVRHFSTQEAEASDIKITDKAAEEQADGESQCHGSTEGHLAQPSQSLSSVYGCLFECRWTLPTLEEYEEVWPPLIQPIGLGWEHQLGPFGGEPQQENHHPQS